MLRLQVGSTCVLNDAKVEIKSARCKSFCRPGCTAIIHPGVQTVYMGVYKLCTPGWRREWFTSKINRISMLTKYSIYEE